MKEGSNQRTQTIEHEKYFKEIGSKWILDLSSGAAMQHLSGFHAKIELLQLLPVIYKINVHCAII